MSELAHNALKRAKRKATKFYNTASAPFRREQRMRLGYFEEALAVELHAVNERRQKIADKENKKSPKTQWVYTPVTKLASAEEHFDGHTHQAAPNLPPPSPQAQLTVDPDDTDPKRMRPLPIPCSAVGVALSGGGIRSGAFCLGALQALDFCGVIKRTDYLSTVSGGGYIGTCLTASMSQNDGEFPFGGASDVRDSEAIGHLRNYSNYLIPRANSALRNGLDVASILLRGLFANALVVLTFQMAAAFLTLMAYPRWDDLRKGNFVLQFITAIPRTVVHLYHELCPDFLQNWLAEPLTAFGAYISAGFSWFTSLIFEGLSWLLGILLSPLGTRRADLILFHCQAGIADFKSWIFECPFSITTLLAGLLAGILIYWAWRRSKSTDDGNDVDSPILRKARAVLGLTILSAMLDLQPLLIYVLGMVYQQSSGVLSYLLSLSPTFLTAAITVALFARRLGAFLETTQLSPSIVVRILRIATQASMIAACLVLPFALFVIYWHLSAWLIDDGPVWKPFTADTARWFGICLLIALTLIMWAFEANAYSLHQFYKDRLSKAFLFKPEFSGKDDPPERSDFKLSEIETAECPYHIINAALNVQGSREANRRGRNADFFTFTRHFVGSDLTHFAVTSRRFAAHRTNDMEAVDGKLDVGMAMAVSGAALSANMGSNTVRWLSPTLALLNIRLGYWLRNPRDLARLGQFRRPREWLNNFLGKFYLLLEMFNFLDEDNTFIYLSDGGHIENLGIYQLLKRGCRLIIAIDAEADPEISCASLLKLERYARIDLGIRIILPWEQIRARNREVNKVIDPRTPGEPARQHGRHCALGPVLYEDGSRGILLYFKSSLSGDEKDYVLDYKKRYRDFPHENTGDQFFTEEQFEVYRTLGYHIVDGYFSNTDDISWLEDGHYAWPNVEAAKSDVRQALGLPPLHVAAAAATVGAAARD
jgi:hypothetical protein